MMTAPVLFIGGLDSSGGAGLLRDAATALSFAAPYRVAVTAVTAQSDVAVAGSMAMPGPLVVSQIALALSGGISVAKTGMLATAETVVAVASAVPPGIPLVIDPVLRASSGGELLTQGGLDAMIEQLLPRATLITPNLQELPALAERLRASSLDEGAQARALLERGCGAVLVKGGHGDDAMASVDRLYRLGQPVQEFRAQRLPGSLRGTGCQLASGVALGLREGLALEVAVIKAKAAVTQRFLAQAGQGDPCPDKSA